MKSYSRVIWLLILAMGLVFVDFFTKAYVFYELSSEGLRGYLDIPVIHVFGVYFSIAFTMNKGAAWGLFSNLQTFLIVIRFIVIFGLLWYLFFINRNKKAEIPLVLILAGAIGNIVDFFLYGFVVDFLHFNFWGYEFPIFNLADSAITIGVIWLFCIAGYKKKGYGKSKAS